MNQEIHNKLNLQPTSFRLGQSFRNDIVIFEFDEKYLIGECDREGRSTPGRYMIWPKGRRDGFHFMREDFLLEKTSKEIKVIVERFIVQAHSSNPF
jgi:hypothetical protein